MIKETLSTEQKVRGRYDSDPLHYKNIGSTLYNYLTMNWEAIPGYVKPPTVFKAQPVSSATEKAVQKEIEPEIDINQVSIHTVDQAGKTYLELSYPERTTRTIFVTLYQGSLQVEREVAVYGGRFPVAGYESNPNWQDKNGQAIDESYPIDILLCQSSLKQPKVKGPVLTYFAGFITNKDFVSTNTASVNHSYHVSDRHVAAARL